MKKGKNDNLKGLLTAEEIEELNTGTFFPLPTDTGHFSALEMKTRIRNLETAGKMPSLQNTLAAVEKVRNASGKKK